MKILIVVDMLNDFIDPDGKLFIGETGLDIIEPVAAKVQEYRDNDNPIIFLCDNHEEDDLEFQRFPAHCINGTTGAMIIDRLNPDDENEFIIGKTRYSGFYGTQLNQVLFDLNPELVEVVGCCTSICVMDTVGGLANQDYNVQIPLDCVADFDQEAHEFALKRMGGIYGAKLV